MCPLRYVVMNHEAPVFQFKLTGQNLNKFNGFFNWTWTYKKQSDIYIPYGQIRKKRAGLGLADPYWDFNYYPDTSSMQQDWDEYQNG